MRSTSTVAKAAVLLLASSSWLGADSLSTPALEPTSHSERHRELKTCAEIEREKKCETPGCAWKDEVCVDCTSINKQKDCADPGCMWTGSCEAVPTTERPTRSPVTYCAGFDKEKDCPIDMADYMGTGLGCQWNEDGKVCENSPTPMPTVSVSYSHIESQIGRRRSNYSVSFLSFKRSRPCNQQSANASFPANYFADHQRAYAETDERAHHAGANSQHGPTDE